MRLLSIFLGVATQIPDTKLQTKLRENVFPSKGTPSLDTNGSRFWYRPLVTRLLFPVNIRVQIPTNKQQTKQKNALLRTSLLWSLCFILFGNAKLCAALSVESQAISLTVMSNRIIHAFRKLFFPSSLCAW
ncbi:Hypothetical protein, putative [Bodo saltans]|uniref:Uncharacterized protein n=1 Tax=Bodo saltans TaxID=75058 RepID=A0A0S4JGU5_BODSA|nr:Hypothetical protein, putative [Bodo saltans]|eukprot:CUG90673.1 Hypothetical protein, putative [Bodo saltans]